MKAESIEQIREHLERGGRVTFSNDDFNEEWEVVKIGVGALFATCNGEIVEIPIYRFNSRDWELLPIEEESLCDKCKYQSDSTQFCHKCKQVWLRLRGEAESEPKPIEKETGICSACPTCGREDDDFDAFEAFEESQGKAWCDKLSEMRQEQEQREMYERIRNALLFGRKPEMADLLAWWQATTGERIEHGGAVCTMWW